MLTRWTDFDRSVTAMDEFRRRMDRLFDEVDGRRLPGYSGQEAPWPRANLWDTGANLVFTAEVPGLTEKDLKLTVHQDVLALEGERKVQAPEGYSVHRRERVGFRFARSFTLPCAVDMERTAASVKNGVLTVTLPKAPEARPRQIQVRGES